VLLTAKRRCAGDTSDLQGAAAGVGQASQGGGDEKKGRGGGGGGGGRKRRRFQVFVIREHARRDLLASAAWR
jgi:uncharacterized spore protein YtfJ